MNRSLQNLHLCNLHCTFPLAFYVSGEVHLSPELRSCFSASCRVDDKAILSFSFICLADTSEEDIWVKRIGTRQPIAFTSMRCLGPCATGLGSWVSGPVVVTDRIKPVPLCGQATLETRKSQCLKQEIWLGFAIWGTEKNFVLKEINPLSLPSACTATGLR